MQNFRRHARNLRRSLLRARRPSLNSLDRKLEKYLDFDGGCFIEAGANDGYTQSNTFYLENSRGWSGVLIEGIPELFEKCRSLRRNSKIYNCALVSRSYSDRTIDMHYADLMSVVAGSLKSKKEESEHIAKGVTIQDLQGTYRVEVEARTLTSVLDDACIERIDFLSLDVEGYEHDVLQGLDFERYRPAFILVEARYFDEVDAYLRQNGYRLVDQLSHHDYLYTGT